MDISTQLSYKTPLSNSPLFPLLLLSVLRQKHTPNCAEKIKSEYDYIIVGSGTAGSVLAGRLSEEPCVSVLVLEAGLKPPLISEVPQLRYSLRGTDVDWNFYTVPQKHLDSVMKDKRMNWVQGKMLGGSGSLNNLCYSRGTRKDYDDWAAQGAKGWSYKDVFPYFQKLEDYRNFSTLGQGFHHTGGPTTIEKPCFFSYMTSAIRKAAEELGNQFRVNPDESKGRGFFECQLNTRDGQRCSSVKGYLVPAEHRPNLDIFLNATVTKVVIEDKKAKGLIFYHNGAFYKVKARKEVILSAGVVNTPKLLMLSGIGPKEELEKWKIPVISNLPVGKNLQDHGGADLYFTIDSEYSMWSKYYDPSTIEEYIDLRTGLLSNVDFADLCYVGNTTSGTDSIDYALLIVEKSIMAVDEKMTSKMEPEVKRQFFGSIDRSRGLVGCDVQVLHPRSRGTISLNSPDPFDPPKIDPNYLENLQDLDDIAEGLMMCKKIVNSKSFRRYGAKQLDRLLPGCEHFAKSDKEYFKCYARRLFYTPFHGVGTVKMGDPNDPTTVVDPELRVKGVKGLRVVDASIMPILPALNTNIPTIMIAEKASDIVRKSIKCLKK